jgi:hypothetical protein
LFEAAEALDSTADQPETVDFKIKWKSDYSSSIAVVGQEVISKSNTTLATVVINWRSNPWEISTGIMFSTLKNQTFSNVPVVTNGQTVTDTGLPTGKALTTVKNTYTRPAVLLPMVMASYRLGFLHWDWENRCPGHCGFLATGGVGLNVAPKTAEFAAGLSFQIGGVIFTAGPHVGRYTDLTQGVVVGSMLGTSPPTPLPTSSTWTTKLGFAVSYVLPF